MTGDVNFFVQRNNNKTFAAVTNPTWWFPGKQSDGLVVVRWTWWRGSSVLFTIPANGRYYFFSFTAVAAKTNASKIYVYFRVHTDIIATSHAPSNNYNLPLVATLKLKKWDRVDMQLVERAIWDKNGAVHHNWHFARGIIFSYKYTLLFAGENYWWLFYWV